MRISVAAAVNDDAMLERCLAASPEILRGEVELRTYRGYRSAGAALNAALDGTDAEIAILAHQDVYLPDGTIAGLRQTLARLTHDDPSWAIAGQVGITQGGETVGAAWSSGTRNGQIAGNPVDEPVQVASIDEMVIIVRRVAGLRFDAALPGFHLYATDLAVEAEKIGWTTYVVPMRGVHFSHSVVTLAGDYARAYHYLRRKHWSRLPVVNLLTRVERVPLQLWIRDLQLRRRAHWRSQRLAPQGDPRAIARRLGYE